MLSSTSSAPIWICMMRNDTSDSFTKAPAKRPACNSSVEPRLAKDNMWVNIDHPCMSGSSFRPVHGRPLGRISSPAWHALPTVLCITVRSCHVSRNFLTRWPIKFGPRPCAFKGGARLSFDVCHAQWHGIVPSAGRARTITAADRTHVPGPLLVDMQHAARHMTI